MNPDSMRIPSIPNKTRNILIVVLIAVVLRGWAVSLLPVDYDEPVYLRAAYQVADALRRGDLNAVIDDLTVREHPALVQLIYSSGILLLGEAGTWTNAFYLSRTVSAILGVLAVLLLGMGLDPLAGGLLAVHTMSVKYTSQVYLEALPHALSIAAVLAFLRTDRGERDRWFWISAIALGAAAAGKFTYIPVIVAVLAYLAFAEKKLNVGWMTIYGMTAIAAFLALNITLWHSPADSVREILIFHEQYSQGVHVQTVGYPWYQPFIWAATSAPAEWHPNVFFYYGFDGLIFIFAVLGLRREWSERRWLVVWLAAGILFLLLWRTKWPQYTLSITPALCITAAESMRRFYRRINEQEAYWNYFREMFPLPGKWFWWSLGAFAAFIAVIYFSAALNVAVGRVGWSHLTKQNSFLPDNTVYDLLALPDGRMAIATERGAAIWQAPSGTDVPDRWTIFTSSNSGLPSDRVLSLARDQAGQLWFGTENGAAVFNGSTWRTFKAEELGLPSGQINALATAGDNTLYAATLAGVSEWNGSAWEAITVLEGEEVFSLGLSGENLFAAAARGVFQIDLTSDRVAFFPSDGPAKHVMIDSAGTIWVATNQGLGRLDDGGLKFYTTTNSGLPLNSINTIVETSPGTYWIATANATRASGIPVMFDGTTWKPFLYSNSGYSGSEPLTIVKSADEQIWIGTRTSGIDLYQARR